MGKRSGLGVPERREAVLSLIRRDEPAAVIARRFGVSEQSLYRWRDDFLAGGEAALAARRNGKKAETRRIKELTRDLEERDRVIAEGQAPLAVRPALTGVGELTIANRLLKRGARS
jgi:transposase-like protein